MKIVLNVLIMWLPIFTMSQSEKTSGIKFEVGLTWEQVKAKARAENKYIFVDCYTTWCKPCKIMDKEVYSSSRVGEYMNDKFVSIKIQMDSTKNDDKDIKLFYTTARAFEREYKVTAFPTYLFFSSDGRMVHRGVGQKFLIDFMAVVAEAVNPEKQFYAIINKWNQGKIPYQELPELAKKVKTEIKDNEIANSIARDYMLNYLEKLNDDLFCARENLLFMSNFRKMISTEDRIFRLCYLQPKKIDSILNRDGFAKLMVNDIISQEKIEPAIAKSEKNKEAPNWNKIQRDIKKMYNKEIAYENVLNAKMGWYKKKKQWESYFKYMLQQIEALDPKKASWQYLNYCAWDVFKYSDDEKMLKTALEWINIAISKDKNPNWAMIDTKACVLYKLGYKEDAIKLEESIMAIFPESVNDFQPRVEVMKKGGAVWLIL